MAESLRSPEVYESAEDAQVVRWYACYTRARHEKRVDEQLRERGIDSYLPLVPRVSQWKDRRKVVEWPLFPSYVFGRFALTDTHRVLSIPGVSTIVRVNGRPVPIPEEELANVRLFARALRGGDAELEHRPFVEEGQWVEVMDGPFRGVRGVVVQRRGRRRVLIGVKAIGQGLEVNLDTAMLRPIAAP
jgi:transcription termination/antitermination protein NusG